MIALELVCLAIVGSWLLLSTRGGSRAPLLRAYAAVALGAWLSEDLAIRLYDFYAYSPAWFPFVDWVPLLVVLIWPMVVLSARRLVGDGPDRPRPWATALLVLADASLVEAVSVRAGLWHWNAPGPFGVPPVGVVGWALYAGAISAGLDWAGRRPGSWRYLLAALLSPLLTHLGLLLAWWGAFRWLPPPPEGALVALGWLLSLGLALLVGRRGAAVPRRELLARIPAVAFFAALLALHARAAPLLLAWAAAFTPPWLVLLWRAGREFQVRATGGYKE